MIGRKYSISNGTDIGSFYVTPSAKIFLSLVEADGTVGQRHFAQGTVPCFLAQRLS